MPVLTRSNDVKEEHPTEAPPLQQSTSTSTSPTSTASLPEMDTFSAIKRRMVEQKHIWKPRKARRVSLASKDSSSGTTTGTTNKMVQQQLPFETINASSFDIVHAQTSWSHLTSTLNLPCHAASERAVDGDLSEPAPVQPQQHNGMPLMDLETGLPLTTTMTMLNNNSILTTTTSAFIPVSPLTLPGDDDTYKPLALFRDQPCTPQLCYGLAYLPGNEGTFVNDSEAGIFDDMFPYLQPHQKQKQESNDEIRNDHQQHPVAVIKPGDRLRVIVTGRRPHPTIPGVTKPFHERIFVLALTTNDDTNTSEGMVVGKVLQSTHHCPIVCVHDGISFPVTAVLGVIRGPHWTYHDHLLLRNNVLA